ncbi:MAG: DUF4097 family beta strand repeat protein [Bacteroidetes bacterium]|nr:DUF4097 family beta strand repeat protein [Bacteroidota bacterium]
MALLCTGVLLLTPALAQAQATRTVSETVSLDRDGEVELSAFTGEIIISTWDRAAVQIDVRIEGDDQEQVDKTQIRIDGSGNRVTIETDYDELEERFLGIFDLGGNEDRPPTFYTITMPATAALSIDDFSSDIEVTGLRNGLELDTFSSTVRLRDLEGRIEAETYSSDFEAVDIAGSIRLETFSGDATIAARALTDDFRFESFSGDVELLLPADAGFDLDVELGMSGDFDSDFALDNVETEGNEYRGSVNGGGPRIRFETFSGDLEIRSP